MQNIQYPLHLQFKVGTLANDFTVTDSAGQSLAYVRQKLLKLIDHIEVYANESRSSVIYNIRANKWIDFSATYTFTDQGGQEIGRIARKGWASIWKAHYEIFDQNQQSDLTVREENPWAKVCDALMGEIPIVGFFTGYLFHPSYIVKRPNGTEVVRLKKLPSFWARKFELTKLADFEDGEEQRIVLGMMMMILLERRRG